MQNDAFETIEPIFVLCSARSGSTLVRYVLDTHADLFCPPEMHLGPLCRELDRLLTIALDGTEGWAPEDGEDSAPGRAPALANGRETAPVKRATGAIRKIVGDAMSAYAAQRNKRRWADKSITSAEHAVLLAEVFPDARFICLYRNCMDVANSLLEACRLGNYRSYGCDRQVERNRGNLVEALAEYWVETNERILAFERLLPERSFRIKYEDIVRHPEQMFRGVFTWLGMSWQDNLLDAVFETPHGRGYGDPKIRFTKRIERQSVGAGSGLPVSRISRPTLERVNRSLTDMGYPALTRDLGSVVSPDVEAEAPPQVSDAVTAAKSQLEDRLSKYEPSTTTTGASYRLVLQDAPQSPLIVRLESTGGSVTVGEGGAASTMVMTSFVLQDILNGRLNPIAAVQTGKVQVSGKVNVEGLLSFLR